MKKIIKLGIPKGSLHESTVHMFKNAGFNIRVSERSYRPQIDDEEIECVLLRAQEIPHYVEEGVIDCGVTGKDWILETNAKVVEVADLIYARRWLKSVKWVVAVQENSSIKNVKDLEGKRIATDVMNLTKNYLNKNKVNAKVEFSWGATEVKIPDLADAIVEITETGESLKANNLRIIDTVLESTTKFIANENSWKDNWKKEKISDIVNLLKGALMAEEKVGLKMNIEKKNLKNILSILPALKGPTVSPLSDENWVAVEVIIDEKIVREVIPKLLKAGAHGIVEYSLNKIIE